MRLQSIGQKSTRCSVRLDITPGAFFSGLVGHDSLVNQFFDDRFFDIDVIA